MRQFSWPEIGIVLAMLASLALQVGIVVAGVWIALVLWHRRSSRRA